MQQKLNILAKTTEFCTLCSEQFEAVVQEGHRPLVHHLLLYACTGHVPDENDGVGDFCYQHNKAEIFSTKCTGTVFGWPTGGNVRFRIYGKVMIMIS